MSVKGMETVQQPWCQPGLLVEPRTSISTLPPLGTYGHRLPPISSALSASVPCEPATSHHQISAPPSVAGFSNKCHARDSNGLVHDHAKIGSDAALGTRSAPWSAEYPTKPYNGSEKSMSRRWSVAMAPPDVASSPRSVVDESSSRRTGGVGQEAFPYLRQHAEGVQSKPLDQLNRSPSSAGLADGQSSGIRTPTPACSACLGVRGLAQELISSLLVLEMEMQEALVNDKHFSQRAPEVARDGTLPALEWALRNIQETTGNLRALKRQHSANSGLKFSTPAWFGAYKRKLDDTSSAEEDAFKKPRSASTFEVASAHGVYPTSITHQTHPHLLPSSPAITTPASADLAPNAPIVSESSPGSDLATQELRESLGAKSRALEVLQKEHDALTQKSDRQKSMQTILERKFETSEVELSRLNDEKDRLQTQITDLEVQVMEAQKARDEARSQTVANSAQYLKIMDMSSRLQAQCAEDKKRWEAERKELHKQVEEFRLATAKQAANVCSLKQEDVGQNPLVQNNRAQPVEAKATSSSTDRAQLQYLKNRVSSLEVLLKELCEDFVQLDEQTASTRKRTIRILDRLERVRELSN